MCIYLSVLPFLFSDWSFNVSGNRTPESERHSSPALEDVGYNNIEELGHWYRLLSCTGHFGKYTSVHKMQMEHQQNQNNLHLGLVYLSSVYLQTSDYILRRNTSMTVKKIFLISLIISCCQDCVDAFCSLFLNMFTVIFFPSELIFQLKIFSYKKLFKSVLKFMLLLPGTQGRFLDIIRNGDWTARKSHKFCLIFRVFLLVPQKVRTRCNFLDLSEMKNPARAYSCPHFRCRSVIWIMYNQIMHFIGGKSCSFPLLYHHDLLSPEVIPVIE